MCGVKDIIWLRLDSIGDAVLSSPMLPYIKGKFGNAKITVVCQEHIRELYEYCPAVDDVITSPSERSGGWGNELRHKEVLNRIKAKNPDILLNSILSTHRLSDMKGLDFIPKRYAFRNFCEIKYTNLISTRAESKSELDHHCDFLGGLGIVVDSLTPQMWLTNNDRVFALKTFQHFNIDPKKTIVLFVGTRENIKIYDRCGDVLKEVCKEFEYNVVTVGTSREYKMNQHCLDVIGRGINLSGKLTIRQIAAVIEKCQLTVGPDTGFSHIACAVQTSNVVIFGGNEGYRFFPYSNLTTLVSIFNGNDIVKNVKSIPPNIITKAIKKVLSNLRV